MVRSCLVSPGELCYGKCLQQKWIPVLRENAPRWESAYDYHLYLHPKRDLSCPAITIKTTTPGAGATVRPAARAARAFLGDLRRNSPSAVLRAKRKASAARMPESATIARRAAMTVMRRGPAVIDRMATGRREAARARSVHSGRAKTAATSARTRHVVTGQSVTAAIAR